jgi:hypothetical protein
MPSSLRLSACLFAVSSALAVEKPKTSLLEQKKPAVASLMESAKSFLKNGATPDVVEFADATLEEVSSIVIPAIINESLSDQNFIYSLHSRFDIIRDALAASNQEVFQLNAEEQAESALHKTCRDEEAVACQGKRNCEMELYRKWTVWVTEEEELREIHGYISGHFCPPDANGTLHAFRVASVPWMQQYMAQKIVVEAAEHAYDVHVPECRITHGALDDKSASCNARQSDLELKACAHATKITDVLTTYYNDFAQAQSAYNCAVEEIMQLERDRKREWITLQVVTCLLGRVHELNGRPCDSESGEVDEEIAFCEQGHYVDVCSADDGEPRLCLDYPPVPPCPEECPARDQVIGVCLPVVQHTPCSGAWQTQEYANLPQVPAPPFSETNPGCNAYPQCVECSDLPVPTPIWIDSCPGYTVDGCVGADEEAGEHPLTFIRDVDGVADVRCCSIDGDTCQSQGFEGGVDFLAPNGSTHTQCYFDVTYQEAMAVCHSAGMRICSVDEMQTCCNTGCWHNHHNIWVDVANGSPVGLAALD